MLTQEDKTFLAKKGISEEKLNAQLECFKTGFPWLKLAGAASPGNGITIPTEAEKKDYLSAWDAYLDGSGKVLKFVPASGAASRMFKNLFEFLDNEEKTEFIQKFEANLDKFAFIDDLKAAINKNGGDGSVKTAIATLLGEEGLSYGKLPKGLLKFHKYEDGARTPVEEHLVEGALYAGGKNGQVTVHFTVSPEHRPLFEALVAKVAPKYEKKFGVKYSVSFSEQKASTDTVAANPDNTPFRGKDGKILFRPGGHGALIENLNDLDADVIFIKNIDNVANERLLPDTEKWKKVLMGRALELRDKIFGYLRELDIATNVTVGKTVDVDLPGLVGLGDDDIYQSDQVRSLCDDIEAFLRDELCVSIPVTGDCKARVEALRAKLNRPIRVCGMVKNQGEPGGGPFIIEEKDGSTSLQVLESVQINMSDEHSREALSKATHFNPVDIVCCLHDYKGNSFNLLDYVDENAGFISSKSYQGRELKALELPGLWNGAMSNWNTLFVEVPLSTFNPVKVVLDLLRPAHQN